MVARVCSAHTFQRTSTKLECSSTDSFHAVRFTPIVYRISIWISIYVRNHVVNIFFVLSLGNYPRPPSYGGAPGPSYSSPGPGMSLGMNASSPMHGQGPGQPCGSMPAARGPAQPGGGRPYPAGSSGAAPTSPSMPQSAGPGMGPPTSGRKPHESGAAPSPQNPHAPGPAR